MDPITILVEIFLKFLEKAKIIYRPKVNVNPLVSPKDPQGGTIVVKRRKDKDWFNIKIELSLFGSLNLSKYLGKHGLIVTIIFKVDNHQVTISDGNKNSVSSLIINENNSEANSTKNFQLICGELSDPDITSTDLREIFLSNIILVY